MAHITTQSRQTNTSRAAPMIILAALIGSVLGTILILPIAEASTATGGCTPTSGSGPFTCTSSGTYAPSGGVNCVLVEAWGGGGGGGGSSSAGYGAGGGAGGSYARGLVSVSSNPYTITVGTGGTGGGTNGAAGSAGQASSFGSTVIANGGAGGTGSTSNTNSPGGAGSTTGSVGSTMYPGGSGGTGVTTPNFGTGGGGGGGAGSTGAGGSSSGAAAGTGTAVGGGNGGAGGQSPGAPGLTYGGGGSGAAYSGGANPGGAGAGGRVVVTEQVDSSTVVASPTSIPPDGSTTSAVTVTLNNPCISPASGKEIRVTSSRGAVDTVTPTASPPLTATTATTNGGGVATFTVKSSCPGPATLVAEDLTDGITLSQTPVVTFSGTSPLPSAAQSTVSASPTSLPADGATTSAVTVTLLSSSGCPAFGKTVTLSSSRGAVDTITTVQGTTDGNGKAYFTIKSNDWTSNGGQSVLTATDTTDGITVTQTATVTWQVPVGGMVFLNQPGDVGQSIPFNPTIRVLVLGLNGAPFTASSIPVTLTLNGGDITAKLVGTAGQTNLNPTPTAATNAATGIASFAGLAVDKLGRDYRLVASSPGLGQTYPSEYFDVGQTGADWPMFKQNEAHTGQIAASASMGSAPTLNTLTAGTGVIGSSPVLGDLDGDGDLDLVVTNDFSTTIGGTMTVRAYRNAPLGTLTPWWTYAIPNQLTIGQAGGIATDGHSTLAIGDLNGDGQNEVVLVSSYRNAGYEAANVRVLAGSTGAMIGAPITFQSAFREAPIIADIDGNGPVVVLTHVGPSYANYYVLAAKLVGSTFSTVFDVQYSNQDVLLNAIQPSPVARNWLPASQHPGSELILSTNTGNSASRVYFCQPTAAGPNCGSATAGGCNATVQDCTVTSSGVMGVSAVDLDNDGVYEVVVNGREGLTGANAEKALEVYRVTNSQPHLVLVDKLQDDFQWNTAALGDVNNDGVADIVNVMHDEYTNTAHDGDISVRRLAGGVLSNLGVVARPAAAPAQANSPNSPGGPVLVDLNLDGRMELVFGSMNSQLMSWRITDSATTNLPSQNWAATTAAGVSSPVAMGDITGDCRPEIFVGLSNGNVQWVRGADAYALSDPDGPGPLTSLAGTARFDSPVNYNLLASWTGAVDPDHNTAAGSGMKARLAWNAVANSGGLPVTHYNVYRAASAAGPFTTLAGVWPTAVPPTPANPFVDVPPSYGTWYYKVAAVTCMGVGPLPSVPFTAEVALPSDAQNVVRAITKGATPAYAGPLEVKVSWDPAAMALARPNGCGPVDTPSTAPQGTDGYNIYRKTGAGAYGAALNGATFITATPSATASYTANAVGPPSPPYAWTDNPAAGAVYTYKVTSKNCVGEKDPGVEVVVDLTYPAAPTSVAATAYGDPAYSPADTTVKKVQVTWAAATTTATCNWIEGYKVYRSTTSGFTPGPANLVATVRDSAATSWPSTPRADPPVAPGGTQALSYLDDVSAAPIPTTYYYKVTAINCAGEGAASAQDSALLQVPNAPAAPTRTGTGTSVTVNWSPPTTGSPVPANNADCNWMEGYAIYRSASSGFTPSLSNRIAFVAGDTPAVWPRALTPPAIPTAPAPASATSYPDPSPLPGTSYYRVAAVNCVGIGAASPELVVVVNQPPVNRMNGVALSGGESVTITEDTAFAFTGATALSATDPDSSTGFTGSLSVTAGTLSASGTGISGSPASTITFSGTLAQWNAALGTLSYSPVLNACGNTIATLTFVTNDGTIADTDAIAIHANCVNDAPVNAVPASASTPEETQLNLGSSVQFTDVDAISSDMMRVSLSVTSGTLTLGGMTGLVFNCVADTPVAGVPACAGDGTADATLTFRGTKANLLAALTNLKFDPAANSCASVTFTITTHDEGNRSSDNLFDTDTFTITVNCVNDPPVNAVPASAAATEDTPFSFGSTVTVADSDNPSGMARVRVSVSSGTLSLSQTTGLAFNCVLDNPVVGLPACAGDGTTDATMTFRGTLSYINAALNGLTFNPSTNSCSPPSVTFTLVSHDEGNTGSGGNLSDTDALPITVACVNDAPVANVQNVNTPENTALGITMVATDVDGDPLTYAIVAGPSNGGLSGQSGASITYTPTAFYCGPDSFTFKANDGTLDSNTATVSITVTCGNDPPTANPVSVTLDEDTFTVVAFSGSDPDVGDTLTYSVVTLPTKGVLTGTGDSRTYTANANACGADSFTYKANDGALDSPPATVSITINCLPDAPTANGQSVTVTEDTPTPITMVANDVDGDALSYIIVTPPGQGTLSASATATRTYTPNLNYCGPDSFTFKANDGALDSNTATVSITVDCVNDAPVATAQSVTFLEDVGGTVTFAGTDVEGDALTYAVVTNPTRGTLSGSGNSRTYTPSPNLCGSDSFTFKANDGNVDSAPATVSITVTCVNDWPVFTLSGNPPSVVMNSGPQTVNSFLTGVDEGGASDEDGQAVTFQVVSNSNPALFSAGPTLSRMPSATSGSVARLQYTTATGVMGSATVCIKATDDGGVANGGLDVSHDGPTYPCFTLTVTSLPLAASLPSSVTAYVGEATPVALTVSGGTPAYGPCNWSGAGSPTITSASCTGATVQYASTGSFSLSVTVGDSGSGSTSASTTVTVLPVNTAPTFVAGPNDTVLEDSGLRSVANWATSISPGSGSLDPGQALAFIIQTNSNTALFSSGPSISPSGTLTYTPAPNAFGVATIGVVLQDDGGTAHGGQDTSTLATFTITVTGVNDVPSALNDPASGCYISTPGWTLNVGVPGVLGNDIDVDGDVLSASLVGGPIPGLTLQPDGAFSFVTESLGTVTYSYRATDPSMAASTPATFCIDVIANGAPTASFTNPGQIQEGGTALFTDTSSDDYGIVTWFWRFGDGHTSFDQNPTHRYLHSGTYTVQLTVTDEFGAQATASGSINVLYQPDPVASPASPSPPAPLAAKPAPENQAPMVRVPATVQVMPGQTAYLDASLSLDPEGQNLRFVWTQIAGPTANLTGMNTERASFVATEAMSGQVLRFRVDVSDGDATARATVQVTIGAPRSAPEVAPLSFDYIATRNSLTVDFQGNAGPDAVWDFGDSVTGVGASPRHTYAQAGTYIVTLTSGGEQVSHSVTVSESHVAQVTPAPSGGSSAVLWVGLVAVILVAGLATAAVIFAPKRP